MVNIYCGRVITRGAIREGDRAKSRLLLGYVPRHFPHIDTGFMPISIGPKVGVLEFVDSFLVKLGQKLFLSPLTLGALHQEVLERWGRHKAVCPTRLDMGKGRARGNATER